MLDIKWIRANPNVLDDALVKRNIPRQAGDILALDLKRRLHVTRVQEAQEKRNVLSKEIGEARACGDISRAEELRAEVSSLKKWLATAKNEERHLTRALEKFLAHLPNIPLEDVPFGIDEKDNVELRRTGIPPVFNFSAKEHYELGTGIGAMDFEQARRIAGTRFTILSGKLARLERAIGQFMLDLHIKEHKYLEVSPPLLVRENALYGVAQLPKFAEDLFQVNKKYWLIPTAEVPLTNLVADQILEEADLPLRFVALTPCFRLEAGSAGCDTRGMLRQHQFWKIEMVSIIDTHSSIEELERMTHCAEEVLKRLELPFRVITLCTGDMGFSAQKTYDLEVWLPGQNRYREISSCSLCGDFQSRRMRARYRAGITNSLNFVHTLNGSGTAVGRCLIAIMENYQKVDGSIVVPQVLRPYMEGIKQIHAER